MGLRLLILDLHRRGEAPADRDLLLGYLERGVVVRRVRSHTIDPVQPIRGRVVPGGLLTDGTWLWPAGHAYHVRTHGVALPAEFVAHVRDRGYAVPPLDATALAEISVELRRLGL